MRDQEWVSLLPECKSVNENKINYSILSSVKILKLYLSAMVSGLLHQKASVLTLHFSYFWVDGNC